MTARNYCKEFAFAPAAPWTIGVGIGVGKWSRGSEGRKKERQTLLTLLRAGDFRQHDAVAAGFMGSSVDCENDDPLRFAKQFLPGFFARGSSLRGLRKRTARGISTPYPRLRPPRSRSVEQPALPRYMKLVGLVVSGSPFAEFTALALISHFHTSRIPRARDSPPRHAAHTKPLVVAWRGRRPPSFAAACKPTGGNTP